jgi:hypothetical protein
MCMRTYARETEIFRVSCQSARRLPVNSQLPHSIWPAWQKLQRHGAFDLVFHGLVDSTHSTFAKFFKELIVRNFFAYH